MKNTITFDQFYKANKNRRITLTKRFGYTNPDDLMTFLKKHKSLTLGELVNSYTYYKKLPREVQLRIAVKNGYSTVAAYMSKLRSTIGGTTGIVSAVNGAVSVTNTNPTTVTKVLNIFILDESSSMTSGGKAESMLNGTREVLQDLKAQQATTKGLVYEGSVVGFSNRVGAFDINPIDRVYVSRDIRGGMTALHDAVGTVLNHLINNDLYKDHKKIVQIFTDGGENASKDFNAHQIATMIKVAEKQDITVTFMGTEEDVASVNRMYSLKEGNSIVHKNTAESIGQTFRMSSKATQTYSVDTMTGQDVSKNFYSKVLLDKK